MANTREVYRVSENGSRTYAGYARFDSNGRFTSFGAGSANRTRRGGRTTVSEVDRAIQTVGARQANARRRAYGPLS